MPCRPAAHRGVTFTAYLIFAFPSDDWRGAVNLLSYFVSTFWAALCFEQPDIVVVETDPPVLCLLGDFLRHWHGCKLVVYLQDIYPDLAVVLGKFPDSWWVRWVRSWLFQRLSQRRSRRRAESRHARAAGGIGRAGMHHRVYSELGRCPCCYPVKTANPFRVRHGIDGEFVVMYSETWG